MKPNTPTEQSSPSLRKNIVRAGIALIAACAIVVTGITIYRKLDSHIRDYDVEITPSSINADGASSALLEIKLISRFGNALGAGVLPYAPTIEFPEGGNLVKVIPLADSLHYRLVAGFETGHVTVRVRVWGAPGPIEAGLDLTASLADRNHNGYPDALDLTSESDRSAFRRWFTMIAVSQLTHLDDRWNDRDCAGLIRYCYREALKRHDNRWLAGRRWLPSSGIPDVRKYNYPNVPLVGTRVFDAGRRPRVDSGSPEGVGHRVGLSGSSQGANRSDGSPLAFFSEFAEAARLKDNSLGFVSRSPDDALPGDVIFYLNDTDSKWPYHTMIYLGNRQTVYHTGPDGNHPGIVKALSLSDLASHPNPRWHPVASNPYFLGFYRWKILM